MFDPMKENEEAVDRSRSVNPVEHIVALDGIAAIVHPGNKVTNLSRKRIRDIDSGRVTNWSVPGGPTLRSS